MPEENMNPMQGSYGYACASTSLAGLFPFFCTDSGKLTVGGGYHLKLDSAEKYMIIAAADGEGEISYRDKGCALPGGSAVLLDCRYPAEYRTKPGGSWSFYYVYFTAHTMEGYKNALLANLTPVRLKSKGNFEKLICQGYRLLRQNDASSCAIQSNIISNLLTEMICSETAQAESSVRCRPEISELEEYIRTHCREQLHLQDFMEHSYFSKYHMIRLFVAQVGMSPYKYLHVCRVNQAQRILKTSNAPISEIAYSVGYSDPIVFTRHFKASLGMTPSEYRNEYALTQKHSQTDGKTE